MSKERCVCCNSLIPEGRQICWSCEHQEDIDRCVVCGKTIPKPNFSFGGRGDGKSMIRLNYNMSQMCCSEECFQNLVHTIQNDCDKIQ